MYQTLFSQKIHYLYEALNSYQRLSKKEFTSYLRNHKLQHPSLENRYKTIQKWFEGGIEKPTRFDFDEYPISSWQIDGGKRAFSYESFMEETSKDDFEAQVDAYIEYKQRAKYNFEYKYIYFYDIKRREITYNSINIIEERDANRHKVEITPAQEYIENGMDTFKGTLNIEGDYYYFDVKNSYKRAALYFMQGRSYRSEDRIEGIALSLAYHNGLPHAHKHILTKTKLSKEEYEQLYLTANESEYIRIDPNYENLYDDTLKSKHLSKLHREINHIVSYIQKSEKLLPKEIGEDIYIKLFQHHFSTLYHISQKVKMNKSYHRYDQRNLTKIFLSIIYKKDKNIECNIIYPTFERELSLFDEHDKNAIDYLNFSIELSENGLKTNRIFIVNSYESMSDYCLLSLEKLAHAGVNIKIVLKDEIKSLKLSSYDLIYDSQQEYAMYRSDIEKRSIFKITQDREKIKEMHHNFEKINDKSITFEGVESFREKTLKSSIDKVLEALIGHWYLYAYRSNITKNDKSVLGYAKLHIKENKEVLYTRYTLNEDSNITKRKGTIDTHSYPHQSVLMLSNIDTAQLSIITLNNKETTKDIFKISAISKSFGDDKDVLGFGILSRFQLDDNVVLQSLGEADETTLIASHKLDERVNQLYINS